MIRELRTFLAVAREGTFAGAADRVGLTQAAVSAQMQRLEAMLGFALFDRTGRSARINAKGHRTLERAQELIQMFENLGSEKKPERQTVLLRIGAIASVQRGLLPNALMMFHENFARCRSHIVPGVSLDLLNRVDTGELDMATIIRPPFTLPKDLRWTTLAHEPYRLLVPRAIKGRDWRQLLAAQPFVRYDRASFGGRQVERFLQAAHIQVRDICELDELEAIVRVVENGLGVALVPQTANNRRWPIGIRSIDLGGHTFHRDIGLIQRGALAPDDPAGALANCICAAFGVQLDST